MKKRRFNLQPKLLLGLVIMAVVLVVALLSVIMVIFGGFMYTYYSWITYDNAYMSSYVIDGDRIAQYYNNGKVGEKDDYYEEIADYLMTVKDEVRFQYLYVAVPEGDNLVYIWYAGDTDGENTHKTGDIVELSEGEMEFMKKAADVSPPPFPLYTPRAQKTSRFLGLAQAARFPANLSPSTECLSSTGDAHPASTESTI